MSIPCKMRPTGLESPLPLGYKRLDFLKCTNSQYIDTKSFNVYEYAMVYSTQNSNISILAGYVRTNDVRPFGIAERPTVSIASTGTYLRSSTVSAAVKNTVVYNESMGSQVKINGEMYNTTAYGAASATDEPVKEDLSVYIFACNAGVKGVYGKARLSCVFSVKLRDKELNVIFDGMPALDPSGRPCMFDTVTRKPFYNAATTGSDFIAGMTIKQARHLAYLPATGGSLIVSLPLEAAFDAKVQSALTIAADKGWTITVQYRESDLTTKNIEADFLESTGSQYIDTGLQGLLSDGFVNFSGKAKQEDKRAFQGSGFAFMSALTNQRRVFCQLPYDSLDACFLGHISGDFTLSYEVSARPAQITINGITYDKSDFNFTLGNEFASIPPYTLKICAYSDGVSYVNSWWVGTIVSVSAKFVNGEIKLTPVIDNTGTPCMYDTVSGQNFYNANTAEGATSFIVGFDTTEKAAISLSKLPLTTTAKELTVSLPAAAEDEASLVPEAINIATRRGWTIIAQYRED